MAVLKGKWRFNKVLDATAAGFNETVTFTAAFLDGDVTYAGYFTGISYNAGRSNLVEYIVGYTAPTNDSWWESGDALCVYLNGELGGSFLGWAYPGAETIDFGTAEQTVSDEFYVWFTANATMLHAVTILYNGQTIAVLDGSQTATLECAGMQMRSDVVVRAETVGGGGSMRLYFDGEVVMS